MSKIVSRTLSVHQEHELLGKLETAGLTDILAQSVIESKNNELAKRVVAYIERGGYEATTSQKLAREIMSKSFLGIEEATQHFGVNFSKDELQALAEIPFSEAVLRECKDTHILVCVSTLSILDIRDKVEDKLFFSHGDAWYNKQKFAKDSGQVDWHLVRKTVVSNSKSKNWDEQNALLSDNENVPSARTMVYTMIAYYLTTGKRLFKNDYVRILDVGSAGVHVSVGSFDSQGLYISRYWDDHRTDVLGLASAWKS